MKWIPVTESLPEERIRVIACDEIGFVCEGFYGRQSSIAGSDKIAWMPLPDPPKI